MGRDSRDARDDTPRRVAPAPAHTPPEHGSAVAVGGLVVLGRAELVAAIEIAVGRALDARQEAPAEWLTVDQAAEFLGYAASYLRKRADVPVHKVGRKRRYRRSELEALLLANR